MNSPNNDQIGLYVVSGRYITGRYIASELISVIQLMSA